jgi:preprotein translocase subunit SecA
MDDIYHTFVERFARVQLVPAESFYYEPPPQPEKQQAKRYNALGILEDIFENGLPPAGETEEMDIGPAEQPAPANNAVEVKAEPVVVGMGKPRPLDRSASPVQSSPAPAPADWTNVGRNDPCPCGSGKKFKKCHGAVIA